MSAPTYRAGGEVVSWCTKCKNDRLHNIIAMVGDMPKRVTCRSCHSEHNFRAPKVEKAPRSKSTPVREPKAPSAPRGAAARVAEAARLERESRQVWERAIAGQPANAFSPYKVSNVFEPGQLVRHTKFGDGVVFKVIDRTKVEILFQDGPRTMAHSMTV